MKKLLLSFSLSLLVSSLQAEPEFADAPEPPDLPDPVESGEAIEPEVTIIQREDARIEEYRVNGQLYMVKVMPNVGPSYYLLDRDGDGHLESNLNEIHKASEIVPQWVLFRW